MIEKELLVNAVKELDENQLLYCMEKITEKQIDRWIVLEWLQEGMYEVGYLYERGEYFIADLIVAGILFRKALSYFPYYEHLSVESIPLGHILIGVMEGDIHDIGKDIVSQTLAVGGFDVIDLGVDVSDQVFVEAVQKHKPDILILCGLMSYSADAMEKTIESLKLAGIRDSVTIIVGGNCIDDQKSGEIEADYYGGDPIYNISLCRKIMEIKSHDNS